MADLQHQASKLKANALLLATFAILAALALGVSGCSADSSESKDQRLVPEYDESSCAIPKTTGEQALSANASTDEIAVSPYFDKKYDRADLKAVLKASSVSTEKYVSDMLGGGLYRIPRSYAAGIKVCPMFTDLPTAPRPLADFWKKNADRVRAPGVLAGLYFEACYEGEYCDDRVITRPTILLDEGRDRWTLVHEMMHHNFNRERKRSANYVGESTLLNQARFSKSQLMRAYEAYRTAPSKDSLSQITEQGSWLSQVFFKETLVRGAYEEIADEGTLLEDFLLGNLAYVAPESARNALWYMDLSLDAGLNVYDQPLNDVTEEKSRSTFDLSLTETHSFIRAEAMKNGWQDLVAQVDADRAAIKKLHDTARNKINDQGERFEQQYPEQVARGHHFMLSSASLTSVGASSAEQQEDVTQHIEESAGMRMFRAFQKPAAKR